MTGMAWRDLFVMILLVSAAVAWADHRGDDEEMSKHPSTALPLWDCGNLTILLETDAALFANCRSAKSLTIDLRQSGLEESTVNLPSLKEVEGSIHVQLAAHDAVTLKSLESVGGDLWLEARASSLLTAPRLLLVQGDLTLMSAGAVALGNDDQHLYLNSGVYIFCHNADIRVSGVRHIAGNLAVSAGRLFSSVRISSQRGHTFAIGHAVSVFAPLLRLKLELTGLLQIDAWVQLSRYGMFYVNGFLVRDASSLLNCNNAGFSYGPEFECHCFAVGLNKICSPSTVGPTSPSVSHQPRACSEDVVIHDWKTYITALGCLSAPSVSIQWDSGLTVLDELISVELIFFTLKRVDGPMEIVVGAFSVLHAIAFPELRVINATLRVNNQAPAAGVIRWLTFPKLTTVGGDLFIGHPGFVGHIEITVLGPESDSGTEALSLQGDMVINTGPFSSSTRGLYKVSLQNVAEIAGSVSVDVSHPLYILDIVMHPLNGARTIGGDVVITAVAAGALISSLALTNVAHIQGWVSLRAASDAQLQGIRLSGSSQRPWLTLAHGLAIEVANTAQVTQVAVTNFAAMYGELSMVKHFMGTIKSLWISGHGIESSSQVNDCSGRGAHSKSTFISPANDCICFVPTLAWPCQSENVPSTTQPDNPGQNVSDYNSTTMEPSTSAMLTTSPVIPSSATLAPATTAGPSLTSNSESASGGVTLAPAVGYTTTTSAITTAASTTATASISSSTVATTTTTTSTLSSSRPSAVTMTLQLNRQVPQVPYQRRDFLRLVYDTLLQGPIVDAQLLDVHMAPGDDTDRLVEVVLDSTEARNNLHFFLHQNNLQMYFGSDIYTMQAFSIPAPQPGDRDSASSQNGLDRHTITGLSIGMAALFLLLVIAAVQAQRHRKVGDVAFQRFDNEVHKNGMQSLDSINESSPTSSSGYHTTALHLAVLRNDMRAVQDLVDEQFSASQEDQSSNSEAYLSHILSLSPLSAFTSQTDQNGPPSATPPYVVDADDLSDLQLEGFDELMQTTSDQLVMETDLDAACNLPALQQQAVVPKSTGTCSVGREEVELSSMASSIGGINASDATGCTPLSWAVQTNNWSIAHFLLQKGADPNLGNLRGQTPLHLACMDAADVSLVTLLLANGARVNDTDEEGWTALMHTARLQVPMPKALQLLTRPDIDCLYQDVRGMTALMHAAVNDQIPLVEQLCVHGDDIMDATGWTALHWAASVGSAKAVSMLLPRTDGFALSTSGETALHLAARIGNCYICQLILSAYKQPSAIFKLLLAMTVEGSTAIDVAYHRNHTECGDRLKGFLEDMLTKHTLVSEELAEWAAVTLHRIMAQRAERQLFLKDPACVAFRDWSDCDSGVDDKGSTSTAESGRKRKASCESPNAKRVVITQKISQYNSASIRLAQQLDSLRQIKSELQQRVCDNQDAIRAVFAGAEGPV